jgi:hypothetical protein
MHTRQERQQQIETLYRVMQSQSPLPLRNLVLIPKLIPSFRPHQSATVSERAVERFARRHQLWIDGHSEQYITMNSWLYPTAITEERLTNIGNIFAFLFYLDDWLGNEQQKRLSQEKRTSTREMILGMLRTMQDPARAPQNRFEAALRECIVSLVPLAPADWLHSALDATRQHIAISTKDHDTGTLGNAFTVEEYWRRRLQVSGMLPTVMLIDIATNNFLSEATLTRWGIHDEVQEMRLLSASLGGLVNDLFSFEKEVIDAADDFNLITIFMLNEGCDLATAIQKAITFINQQTLRFFELESIVASRASTEQICSYLDALRDILGATWYWQNNTARYRRPNSIFAELRN